MQKELESYFGFNAAIETRRVRCWRLVASNSAIMKLATKGGNQYEEEIIPRVSYKYSNMPMKQLVQYLLQFTNDEVIIDETGITQNIDITTDCMDFDSMQTFLPKYGLKLIPAEKEMKVVVIRDPKQGE